MKTDKQLFHEYAVDLLRSHFHRYGFPSSVPDEYNCSYDLMVAGKIKLEVKVSEQKEAPYDNRVGPSWNFNFHRHGKLNAKGVCYYALYCTFPGRESGIWLFVPRKIIGDRMTLTIGWRAMAREWGRWEGFDAILEKISTSTQN
jgi:hypothetical protein